MGKIKRQIVEQASCLLADRMSALHIYTSIHLYIYTSIQMIQPVYLVGFHGVYPIANSNTIANSNKRDTIEWHDRADWLDADRSQQD